MWRNLITSGQLNGYESALTAVIIEIRVKCISTSFTNFGSAFRILNKVSGSLLLLDIVPYLQYY
jgi:hypothetical protein